MNRRKIKIFILSAIPVLLLIIFGLTYIPHNMISIEPSEVKKITVFDASLGHEIVIIDHTDIEHIINNLNKVTFQKGKPSLGYTGHSFKVSIYNSEGETIKSLIIKSENNIRYKGFMYHAKDRLIDFSYIENLIE